jgi:hypothetical protein
MGINPDYPETSYDRRRFCLTGSDSPGIFAEWECHEKSHQSRSFDARTQQ